MIPTSVVPIASVSMVVRASATAVSAAIRYSKPYAATVSTRSSSAFAASLPFCINAKEAGTIVRPSDAGLRSCNSASDQARKRSSAPASAAATSSLSMRSNDFQIAHYFVEQRAERDDGFGRHAISQAGWYQATGFVQRRMRRTSMIDAHQRSVVQAHGQISRPCDSPEAGKRHGAGEDHQRTKREKELVTNGHHRAPASGWSGMTFLLTVIRSIFLFEHDLVGKPVPTFPDHALSVTRPSIP